MNGNECEIEDCAKTSHSHSVHCSMHRARIARHGSPDACNASRGTPQERFWRKVDKDGADGCWIWQGATQRGYGCLRVDGKARLAHRLSFEWARGAIPDALPLDHVCRTPRCVNPDHLEPVTYQENSRRAMWIGHDHPNAPQTCKRGHDWSIHPPQVNMRNDGRIRRQCKVCARMRQDARRLAGSPAIAQGVSYPRVGIAS